MVGIEPIKYPKYYTLRKMDYVSYIRLIFL